MIARSRLLCFSVCFPLFSACAGAQHASGALLSIASAPEGANVLVSGSTICTTPCSFEMPRGDYVAITLAKPGCLTQTQLLPPGLQFEPELHIAASEMSPNQVSVTLNCPS